MVGLYACSPRIRLASRMSFGMMETRLAWMAHRWRHQTALQGMPLLLPGDTVSPPTGTTGLSCSPGQSPSPTSGKVTFG